MEMHLRKPLEGTFEAKCSSMFFLYELSVSIYDYLDEGLDVCEGTFHSEIDRN